MTCSQLLASRGIDLSKRGIKIPVRHFQAGQNADLFIVQIFETWRPMWSDMTEYISIESISARPEEALF